MPLQYRCSSTMRWYQARFCATSGLDRSASSLSPYLSFRYGMIEFESATFVPSVSTM